MTNNFKSLSKFWNGKKVFLTGHTGFKGSWFSIFLNLLGAKVAGYSLKPNANPNLYDFIDYTAKHDSHENYDDIVEDKIFKYKYR